MFKKMKYAVLKTREVYYRWMWTFCMNRRQKCLCEKDYKTSYAWRDRGANYLNKQIRTTKKLWSIDR